MRLQTLLFEIYDDSVERVNIGGTHQLLKWAQTLEDLDTLYVGTATICGSTVKECVVTEDMSPDLKQKPGEVIPIRK